MSAAARGPGPGQNPYLYHAECAGRWLISLAIEPSPGQYKWYASDLENTKYCLEQSTGACGIGQFFLQLYNATGNATYLKYAEGAGKWIISQAVSTASDACKWTSQEGYPYYSPDRYGGQGVIVEYLLLLYQVTGNATYLTYCEKGANWLIDIAVSAGGGYKWETFIGGDYNMTGWYHGTAGVSYGFLLLYQETGNTTYLGYAKGGAKWLISIATSPAAGEYAWVRVETDAAPDKSWCGGTTGIVEFFLALYQTTGNATYLSYAKGGGNWLISQSTTISPGNVSMIYTNIFCHGDPSCAWLMFLLYNATGNATYLNYGKYVMNWLISQKIDVNQNETKWPHLPGGTDYIIGIMMGVSGIGHAFILSHELTAIPEYRDLALKAANWVNTLNVEVSPGVEKWNYMEKIDPTEEYCTGWYWGVAGIGQFLLEVAPYWDAPPRGVDIQEQKMTGFAGPGKATSYVIHINNTGVLSDTIVLNWPQPQPGWSVDVKFDGSGMAPSAQRTAVINVTTPAGALAGENVSMVLSAVSVGDQNVFDIMNITTFVSAVYGVDILQANITNSTDPLKPFSAEFYIKNTGNALDDIDLNFASSRANWDVAVSFDGVDVPASGSRYCRVNVTPPAGELAGNVSYVILTARSHTNSSVIDVLNITVSVNAVYGVDILTPDMVFTYNWVPILTSFKVKNTGNVMASFDTGHALMFEKWCAPGYLEFDLLPGEVMDVPVGIGADDTINPGTYKMSIGVFCRIGDDYDVINYTLVIGPRYNLSVLDAASLPISHLQGKTKPNQTISYPMVISNTGNVNDTIELSSSTPSAGWKTEMVFNGQNLSRNETRPATIRVTPPASALADANDTITLTVRSKGNVSVSRSVVITTSVLQVAGFEITPPQGQSALPGQGLAYLFKVKNIGNADDRFEVYFDSSCGSNILFPGRVLITNMSPLQEDMLSVNVTIPQFTPAGTNDVLTLHLRSIFDPNVWSNATVTTTVLPYQDLNVTANRTHVICNSGQKTTIAILVTNLGNMNANVVLSLSGKFASGASLSEPSMVLKSNESKAVVLTLDPSEYGGGDYDLEVTATWGNYTKTSGLTVTVISDGGDEDEGLNAFTTIMIIVVAVIVLAAALFIFILMKGKKEKAGSKEMEGTAGDEAEAEERRVSKDKETGDEEEKNGRGGSSEDEPEDIPEKDEDLNGQETEGNVPKDQEEPDGASSENIDEEMDWNEPKADDNAAEPEDMDDWLDDDEFKEDEEK